MFTVDCSPDPLDSAVGGNDRVREEFDYEIPGPVDRTVWLGVIAALVLVACGIGAWFGSKALADDSPAVNRPAINGQGVTQRAPPRALGDVTSDRSDYPFDTAVYIVAGQGVVLFGDAPKG